MSGEAEYWTFPTSLDEFDKDERISFSRLDNKYIAVQDDGTEYEFDTGLKRWIPMIDEALIQEQQKGYFGSGIDNDDTQSGSAQGGRKRNRSDEREVSCARMQIQSPPRTHMPRTQLLPEVLAREIPGRGRTND